MRETALSDAADRLWQALEAELRAVPVSHWGFFFPCLIACWRFSCREHPALFGPLHMEYTARLESPVSTLRVDDNGYCLTHHVGGTPETGVRVIGQGPGFSWFARTFLTSEPPSDAFTAVESIMYAVADALGPEALRSPTLKRISVPRPATAHLEALAAVLRLGPLTITRSASAV